MLANVHHMNIAVNADCAWRAINFPGMFGDDVPMQHRVRRKTYLRAYRKAAGRTLEAVAEELHMTHGQLSKIERGLQPYNQDLLETLADLYMCGVGDLINRPPGVVDDINKVVAIASPEDQEKILKVARTIVGVDEEAA